MKWILGSIVVFLLATTLAVAQSEQKVSLVASRDAPGSLSVHRLERCLEHLAREWKVPVKELPHVVVFHVSRKVADSAFVLDDVAVRRNRSGNSGEEYYELWLVGQPDRKYVLALQNVIEYHFGLKPTDDERATVVARVARIEDATVNVAEGK